MDCIACQAPLSMGFPRQEYWSGQPFSSSGRSSPPRDWTHVPWVSCIGGRFFTAWATREARSFLLHPKLFKLWEWIWCQPTDAGFGFTMSALFCSDSWTLEPFSFSLEYHFLLLPPCSKQSFLTVFCAPKWFSLSLFLILASLQYKILLLSLKISDIRCYLSN